MKLCPQRDRGVEFVTLKPPWRPGYLDIGPYSSASHSEAKEGVSVAFQVLFQSNVSNGLEMGKIWERRSSQTDSVDNI